MQCACAPLRSGGKRDLGSAVAPHRRRERQRQKKVAAHRHAPMCPSASARRLVRHRSVDEERGAPLPREMCGRRLATRAFLCCSFVLLCEGCSGSPGMLLLLLRAALLAVCRTVTRRSRSMRMTRSSAECYIRGAGQSRGRLRLDVESSCFAWRIKSAAPTREPGAVGSSDGRQT